MTEKSRGKDSRRSLKPFSLDHNVTLDVTIPSAVAKFARSIPIRPIGTARRGIKVDLWFNRRLVLHPPPTDVAVHRRRSLYLKGNMTELDAAKFSSASPLQGVSRARARAFVFYPFPRTPPLDFDSSEPVRVLPFAYARSSYSTLGALSIPITLKLSINSAVERFTRGGKWPSAISRAQMSTGTDL